MTLEQLKEEVTLVQELQRQAIIVDKNSNLNQRLKYLKQLKKMLIDNEHLWLQALKDDLGKPPVEAYASELGIILNEIDYMLANLKKWTKPKTNKRILWSGLEMATIQRDPFGSTLVLAPWNYPLQLGLVPTIGALAAGNRVVLKPSEAAVAISKLLKKLVPQYFEPEVLFVIEGDAEVADALTDLSWDFIFFTGSPEVGQQVYEKAAQHLTPVVLELGGKNPCIIDESAFNKETVQQIIWGKFLNAGQTCIAPDTVFVPRTVYPDFLEAAEQQIIKFYGKQPQESKDYGRLIHSKHLDKMRDFVKQGEVWRGGEINEETLFLAPTLLVETKKNSPIRTEEIFGPLLPIVPYDTLGEVLDEYQQLPIPLVTYLFTKDDSVIEKVQEGLESSALSVNQVLVHASSPMVPFGGKGQSGLGNYHGYASFKTFTHERILYQKKMTLNFSQQFPPYKDNVLKILRRFRKKIL